MIPFAIELTPFPRPVTRDTMYNYSPKPIEAYMLPRLNGLCEAGQVSKLDRAQAVWNLFWLSVPTLDTIPEAGPLWYKHYRAIEGVCLSITTDVCLDDVMYRKLMMHPNSFVAWFEREDHTIYDVYDLLGQGHWVQTVLLRARESAKRMSSSIPDNVFSFIKRVA